MAQARAALPAPDVRRVVAVQRGDAEQVAERLRTALDEYPKEPGQSMDPVDVSVLSITNELVLIGPEQWVQTGISLLAKVDRLGDGVFLGLEKGGPATAGIVLSRGVEQRRAAALAGVGAFLEVVVVLAGEGAFGALLAKDLVFFGRQDGPPFGVSFHDFIG